MILTRTDAAGAYTSIRTAPTRPVHTPGTTTMYYCVHKTCAYAGTRAHTRMRTSREIRLTETLSSVFRQLESFFAGAVKRPVGIEAKVGTAAVILNRQK